MRRCVCISLLLCQFAVPAMADSLWMHNGSVVRLRGEGSQRHLEYVEPRSGLRNAGVKVGTVLFRGKLTEGHFSGTAYRFSRQCGAIGYPVAGMLMAGQSLTLTGRVPIRNRKCAVTGYGEDVLVFSPQSAPGGQAEKQDSDVMETPGHEPSGMTGAPERTARLPFTVIGCKSLETFAQWVREFREADADERPEVFRQGMQTEDCAAIADGPVEIVKTSDSYLCVRPRQNTQCYWTLKAVFDRNENSPRNSPS